MDSIFLIFHTMYITLTFNNPFYRMDGRWRSFYLEPALRSHENRGTYAPIPPYLRITITALHCSALHCIEFVTDVCLLSMSFPFAFCSDISRSASSSELTLNPVTSLLLMFWHLILLYSGTSSGCERAASYEYSADMQTHRERIRSEGTLPR